MSDVHVTLSGYVASEVEFKEGFNRAGERMAHNDRAFFRLGATPRYFDRSAGRWRDGETVWLTVKAWRALAHNVASSLSLGQPVVVVGKLKTSVWKGEDEQVHSREVLEATVVGHDLNRGTSAFSRTSRQPEQHDPAPEEDDAATMSSLQTPTGTSVDPLTGELVDARPPTGSPQREPEPAF
jgi:single-strand DNA-binding protein